MRNSKPSKKQIQIEAYCQGLMGGYSQSNSYKMCNPKAKNWANEAVYVRASEFNSDPKVQARLKVLQAETAIRNQVDTDSLIRELEEARQVGKTEGTATAMVMATMGKAKITGLDKKAAVNSNEDILIQHLANFSTAINAAQQEHAQANHGKGLKAD